MAHFGKTRWSLVLAAGAGTEDSQKALAELCQIYWYPVYSFIRRRRGGDAEAARDLTQDFFEMILERRDFDLADCKRGSFGSWLRKMASNLLANDRRFRTARKRDFRVMGSLDADDADRLYQAEAAQHADPEQLYHRNEAYGLLERVFLRLRAECAAESATKARRFEQVKALLIGPEGEMPVYAPYAEALGMQTGALKTEVCRLRARFGELVREEVGHLVATPEEIPSQISFLLGSLSLKAV